MRADVYDRVTRTIVEELEKGVRPWHKPWNGNLAADRISRPLRSNGIPYRGINIIMLWCAAMERGFSAPMWMTYKQAVEAGAHVRKGETATHIVYASTITRTGEDAESGEGTAQEIPFMKGYSVFNVEQIEGLPASYYPSPALPISTIARDERADAFIAAAHADICHGGNQAYYSLHSDHVQMPPLETFEDSVSYYATLTHELTHWTRHPSRLDREFGRKRFGDEGYAMEELVAELGAAFLCADLGLTPEPRADHAAYIASWIKVLKADKRAIFNAAAHAQRAADFLHALQPQLAIAA